MHEGIRLLLGVHRINAMGHQRLGHAAKLGLELGVRGRLGAKPQRNELTVNTKTQPM